MKIQLAVMVMAIGFLSACSTEENKMPAGSTGQKVIKNKTSDLQLGYLDEADNFEILSLASFKAYVRESLELSPSAVSSWGALTFHEDIDEGLEFVRVNINLNNGSTISFSQSLKDGSDYRDSTYRLAGGETCTCVSTGCDPGCEVHAMCDCTACMGGECTKTHTLTTDPSFTF